MPTRPRSSERTRAVMVRLHHWTRARRRYEVAALPAVVGMVLIGVGLLGM